MKPPPSEVKTSHDIDSARGSPREGISPRLSASPHEGISHRLSALKRHPSHQFSASYRRSASIPVAIQSHPRRAQFGNPFIKFFVDCSSVIIAASIAASIFARAPNLDLAPIKALLGTHNRNKENRKKREEEETYRRLRREQMRLYLDHAEKNRGR